MGVIDEPNAQLEQLTPVIDEINGDYTRLTRFKAGADTKELGKIVMITLAGLLVKRIAPVC